MNDNLSRTSPLKKILRSQAFTLLIMLVLLVLVFSFTAKLNNATFFKMKTLISIMQDLAVPGFLAIGAIPSVLGIILSLATKKKSGKKKAGLITSLTGLVLSVLFLVI